MKMHLLEILHEKQTMSSIIVSDPDQFRRNVATSLFETFLEVNGGSMETAASIEDSIYQFAVNRCHTVYKIPPTWSNSSFVNLYTGRFRSLFHNLKYEPSFLARVVDGTISQKHLEKIQHVEISEKKWAPYIQELLEREMYTQNQNQSRETSDMFVCPNCSSNRSTFYSLQTRGGDEPMTIFINCADCNYKWTE